MKCVERQVDHAEYSSLLCGLGCFTCLWLAYSDLSGHTVDKVLQQAEAVLLLSMEGVTDAALTRDWDNEHT